MAFLRNLLSAKFASAVAGLVQAVLLLSLISMQAYGQTGFSLSLSPSSQTTIWQGQSVSYLVTVSANQGFSGAIALSASGLSSSMNATVTPATFNGSGTATLTISTSPGIATGSYSALVLGASGSQKSSASLTINVTQPPPFRYTYDAIGRLTSVINPQGNSAQYSYDAVGNLLSITRENANQLALVGESPAHGIPGSTVTFLGSSFDSLAANNSVIIGGAAAVVSSVSPTQLTAIVPAQASTGLVSVANSSGSVTSSFVFTVDTAPSPQGPDFALSSNPSSLNVVAGSSAATLVSASGLGSFNGSIGMSVSGLPSGATATFSANTIVAPGNSLLTVNTTTSTPSGTYSLQISGSSGAIAHTLSTSLTVGSPSSDFSVTSSGTSQTINTNGTASFSATVTLNTSTVTPINLVLAGAPAGSIVNLGTTSLQNSGSVPFTVTPGHTTPAGTYPLVLIATAGNVIHTLPFTLTIGYPDFSLSLSHPVTPLPSSGGSVSVVISLSPVNGFSDTATLTMANLPSGATATFNPPVITAGSTSTLTLTVPQLPSGFYNPSIVASLRDAGNGGYSHATPLLLPIYQSNAVPAGWNQTDIGSASIGGESWSQSGAYALQNFGGVSTPTADQFRYVYSQLQGDGQIIARVVTGTGPSSYSAGIMIRDGTNPSASNVFLFTQGGASVNLSYRSGSGTATQTGSQAGMSLPGWLKIVRQGNSFNAFTSTNGAAWTQVGTTISNSMSSTVTVGLVTSTGTANQGASATFDNVVVNSGTGFGITTPANLITIPQGQSISIALSQWGTNYPHSIGYSVSGLPSNVSASFSPTSLTGSGGTTMTISVPAGSTAGTFPLTIVGTDAVSGSTQSVLVTLIIQPAPGSNNLPPGWVNQDVGGPGISGTTAFGGGVFVLQGSGAGGSSDQFQYAFTQLNGDGTIAARLVGLQNMQVNSTPGVMIRNSLGPNSSEAFLTLQAGSFVNLYTRGITNSGGAEAFSGINYQTPVWLKLTRQGNSFTAFISADGATWLQSGAPETIAMNSTVFIGLALSSANNSLLSAAVFDNVTVTSANQSFTIAPSSLTQVVSAGTTAMATITQVSSPSFTDTVNYSVSGLPAGVTANFTPSSLTGSGPVTLQLVAGSGATAGTYQLTVTGTDATNPGQTQTSSISMVVPPSTSQTTLPTGWTNQDIGGPTIAGSTAFGGGVFALQGSGSDIWGSSDQFQYAFTQLQGDGSIVARLVNLKNIQGNSKPGVMIRNTLAPTSSHVFLALEGGTFADLLMRNPDGGTGGDLTQALSRNTPIWLQVVRQGNNFSTFYSPDGATWTQLGTTQTVAMNSTVFIGLALSSANNSLLSTAVFDNVTVTSANQDFTIAPSSLTQVVSAGTSATAIITQVSSPSFTDTVSYSVSGLPAGVTANFTPNSLTGSGPVTLQLAAGSGAAAGTFQLTVTGTDATNPGQTQTSSISMVVPPSTSQTSLPTGWTNQDIGGPTIAGSTAFGGGVFALQGSGSDIWGSSDQFQYAFTQLQGDGSIVARLVNLKNIQGNSKPGVMIRNTLAPTSSHVFLALEGGTFADLLMRNPDGGTGGDLTQALSRNTPIWLQVVRQGNNFSTFYSPDGATWTQLGTTQTVAMNSTVFIGLALSSANNSLLSTAVFDNVTVTKNKLVFTTPPMSTTAGATMSNVVVQVQDVNGSLVSSSSATVTLISNPSGISQSQTAVNGVATFSGMVLNTVGSYTLTASSSGLTPSPSSSTFNITAAGGNPSFTSSGSASPNPVNAGQATAISATVSDTANSLSNGNIQILVYDSSGNQVAYQNFLSVNFSSGQSQTYSMQFTASSAGTYTARLGVFDSNWNLLHWNNSMASITANTATTFTSSGSASPNPVNTGQATSISATVNDGGNALSNGNIQILVYDSSGNQAAYQNFQGVNFSSGQSQSYSMQFTPSSAGTFTARLGVFDSNWNLLYWNNTLASITANAGISFSSSATAQPLTVSRGSSTSISFTVTDTGGSGLTNANVEVQIFNSSWSSVLVQNWPAQNFSAAQSLSYSYSWNVASSLAPGTYYVAVAVYDSAWSSDYWNNDATITVQ